jgi:predicted RNase H-like nuclease
VGTYLGLDGFRGGWVAAWINERGNHWFGYSSSLARLLSYPHDMAMIDIPIGLPERGYRKCDVQAREWLGPSVFLGARRGLLNFGSQAEANQHYRVDKEPGVSSQLWCIRCKIKEVDDVMTPERQKVLRETHPELVLWHLNSKVLLDSKKTDVGRSQRLAILNRRGFTKAAHWLNLRYGTGIGRDDLIDACICAIAARDARDSIGGPCQDCRGLRMEMWY